MTDREKIVKELYDLRRYLEDKEWSDNRVDRRTVKVYWQTVTDAIAMLKEQENEYENGFNDAMLGKQELMYEGTDGKWHKKDW